MNPGFKAGIIPSLYVGAEEATACNALDLKDGLSALEFAVPFFS